MIRGNRVPGQGPAGSWACAQIQGRVVAYLLSCADWPGLQHMLHQVTIATEDVEGVHHWLLGLVCGAHNTLWAEPRPALAIKAFSQVCGMQCVWCAVCGVQCVWCVWCVMYRVCGVHGVIAGSTGYVVYSVCMVCRVWCTGCVWCVCSVCMACVQCVYGVCAVCVWCVCRVCIVCVCVCVCRVCMLPLTFVPLHAGVAAVAGAGGCKDGRQTELSSQRLTGRAVRGRLGLAAEQRNRNELDRVCGEGWRDPAARRQTMDKPCCLWAKIRTISFKTHTGSSVCCSLVRQHCTCEHTVQTTAHSCANTASVNTAQTAAHSCANIASVNTAQTAAHSCAKTASANTQHKPLLTRVPKLHL